MNHLPDKETNMIIALYVWLNRVEYSTADTEDKDLTKMVIYNLLWMTTQE